MKTLSDRPVSTHTYTHMYARFWRFSFLAPSGAMMMEPSPVWRREVKTHQEEKGRKIKRSAQAQQMVPRIASMLFHPAGGRQNDAGASERFEEVLSTNPSFSSLSLSFGACRCVCAFGRNWIFSTIPKIRNHSAKPASVTAACTGRSIRPVSTNGMPIGFKDLCAG